VVPLFQDEFEFQTHCLFGRNRYGAMAAADRLQFVTLQNAPDVAGSAADKLGRFVVIEFVWFQHSGFSLGFVWIEVRRRRAAAGLTWSNAGVAAAALPAFRFCPILLNENVASKINSRMVAFIVVQAMYYM
jgi:hypothetical protein